MSKTETESKWRPGQSGNPKGRPRGSGEVAKLRESIAQRLPALLDSLISRAMYGDMAAARLLLERTVAPLKAVEPAQALDLPKASLSQQGHAVLNAAAMGEVTPAQATALIGAMGALAKVIEFDELEARIRALETANGNAQR